MSMVDVNLPLDDLATLVDFGDDELKMTRFKQGGATRARQLLGLGLVPRAPARPARVRARRPHAAPSRRAPRPREAGLFEV